MTRADVFTLVPPAGSRRFANERCSNVVINIPQRTIIELLAPKAG